MIAETAHLGGSGIRVGTWPTPEQPVIVRVPVELVYSLERMRKVQAAVLDRLGCPQCHSGYDIRFETGGRALSFDARELTG